MKHIRLMMSAAAAVMMAFAAQAEKTAKAVVENDGKTLRFVYDTANATNMNLMFGSCWALASLDVTGFDTANVTNMYEMFYACSSLTSLDVTGFDTSKVTDMYDMFG